MLIALPEYDNNVFGALVSSGHLCEAEAPTEPTPLTSQAFCLSLTEGRLMNLLVDMIIEQTGKPFA